MPQDRANFAARYLKQFPRDATKDLRNLVEQALSDGTVEEQVEAFDAAVRIPASDDVARRWLARTPADVAALALLRLRNHDAAQVITLLASATTVVKRAAVAALTWLPIAAIAVIAQGDFCSFAALRDRSDFGTAPMDVLAKGIIHGCGNRYVDFLNSASMKRGHVRPRSSRLCHSFASMLPGA